MLIKCGEYRDLANIPHFNSLTHEGGENNHRAFTGLRDLSAKGPGTATLSPRLQNSQ